MGINEKLLTMYDQVCICSGDCAKLVKRLMTQTEINSKRRIAISIMEHIMKKHSKGDIVGLVEQVSKIEKKIQLLDSSHRDHVVHSVLTFILGNYIRKNFFESEGIDKISDFQWRLACIFHDIGYSLCLAGDMLIKQVTELNHIVKFPKEQRQPINVKIIIEGLDSLTKNTNSIDCIQGCIDSWEIKVNARNIYKMIKDGRKRYHGAIGSLLLLYSIDSLYDKNNPDHVNDNHYVKNMDWSYRNMKSDIVPACTAIFLHDLPAKEFKCGKIDIHKAPLAYLLRLADCLQEWDRPSIKNPNGYNSCCFDIDSKDEKLIFSIIGNNLKRIKNKIKKEIEGSLVCNNIVIEAVQ